MAIEWGPGLPATVGRPMNEVAYERYVGRWSRLFVPTVLTAAGVAKAQRVLDVATGTGEAAALAVTEVGPAGLVVGVDIAPAMLRGAQRLFLVPTFRPVVTDGQALAFANESFDAVICQLGLMFFPAPARGLAEFRRVLRPGRRAAVCVISSPDRAPMWGVLAETLSRHLPAERAVLHSTFALADAHELEQLFREAGFADVTVARETREAVFDSFEHYWAPIEVGAGSLPQAYRALPEPERQVVRAEVKAGLSQFASNGRLHMSVEMLIGAGRA